MKRYFISIFLCSFFFLMLCLPRDTFLGAVNGLLLWYQTLLPTLLPFVILTNLLILTNSIQFLQQWISPLLAHFFFTSPDGCFAILTGFLCGYPVGAKTIADLRKSHRISTKEAQYLLSFCNNASPMFLIGYIIHQKLNQPSLTLPLCFLFYLCPILLSFFFRRVYGITKYKRKQIEAFTPPSFSFSTLDLCIHNSVDVLVKTGCYLMLFSISIQFLETVSLTPALSSCLTAILEITRGIAELNHTYDFPFSIVMIMGFTAFGGICSLFQTKSVIQDTELSIVQYTLEKLITALVTSLFTYLYVSFILL